MRQTTVFARYFLRGRIHKNQSGWFLIDSLIGITIITVGVVAIMASYIQTTKSSSYSDHATQAAYLAQQELEIVKKTYDGGTVRPVLPANGSNGIFSYSFAEETATEAALPVAGLNIVPFTITVSWTDASSTQQNSISITAYYYYFNS